MGFFDSLIQTPVYQAQNMLEKPGQALIGANTPLETNMWNKVLGTNMTPTMNMYGGPSEATYAKAQREGVDLSAGRFADSLAPAAAGAVAGAFTGGAGAMPAYMAANSVGQMGRQGEISQIQQANMAKGLPAYQAQSFAKGGLASANKQIEQTQIMKVFEHYFKNLGVDVKQGMVNLKKEIAQGLQLIPFESSVMGFKPLDSTTAQIHFFTVGTLKALTDDMQYFFKYLKNKGIRTVYDTLPAPITTQMLVKLGAKLEQSDNPKYNLKASI
jgi:hypothetical protein